MQYNKWLLDPEFDDVEYRISLEGNIATLEAKNNIDDSYASKYYALIHTPVAGLDIEDSTNIDLILDKLCKRVGGITSNDVPLVDAITDVVTSNETIELDKKFEDAYKPISFTEPAAPKDFTDWLVWKAVEAKIDYLIEHSDITFDELKTYVEKKKLPFYVKEKV